MKTGSTPDGKSKPYPKYQLKSTMEISREKRSLDQDSKMQGENISKIQPPKKYLKPTRESTIPTNNLSDVTNRSS